MHGRADLLRPLVDAIRSDLDRTDAARKVIVFLGDYVDRGRDSRGVFDLLVDLSASGGLETRFVRGNHEDRMEAFLDDPSLGPAWCEYGGREALTSYGVAPPRMRTDAAAWADAARALREALPEAHARLLSGRTFSVEIGDYFFAHAGVRPGVPLDAQSPDDLMWIRQPFLDHPRALEKVVVHGHTPSASIVSNDRRIGVDTGAYATDVLSAVRLEGEGRAFLQAVGREDRVAVSAASSSAG